jgi:hypothetical protein
MGPKTPHKAGTFNYEMMMLRLTSAVSEILSSGTLSVTPTPPTPVTVVPALSIVTGAGTVAAGKKSVAFLNKGLTSVTVLGVALGAGESVSFSTSLPGETLSAVAYDATGSQLLISTLT